MRVTRATGPATGWPSSSASRKANVSPDSLVDRPVGEPADHDRDLPLTVDVGPDVRADGGAEREAHAGAEREVGAAQEVGRRRAVRVGRRRDDADAGRSRLGVREVVGTDGLPRPAVSGSLQAERVDRPGRGLEPDPERPVGGDGGRLARRPGPAGVGVERGRRVSADTEGRIDRSGGRGGAPGDERDARGEGYGSEGHVRTTVTPSSTSGPSARAVLCVVAPRYSRSASFVRFRT